MKKLFARSLLSAAALSLAAGSLAQADSIEASLTSPLAPTGKLTVVDLTGISTPSHTTIRRPGFSVSFINGPQQGVVRNAAFGLHAIPIGGVADDSPEYLTGNYGSDLTLDPAASGNYFSTGTGTITIKFSTPETSLAVLWGSIDASNSLTFNDAAKYIVSGSDVQVAAAGFASDGFQGPGGSAYVIVNTDTPFTTVTAHSKVVSFEFGGIAGDTSAFTTPTPEPASALLSGLGFTALGLISFLRRRRPVR